MTTEFGWFLLVVPPVDFSVDTVEKAAKIIWEYFAAENIHRGSILNLEFSRGEASSKGGESSLPTYRRALEAHSIGFIYLNN